jgi:hypothetical protein
MSQDNASSISVVAFRADRYSEDGKSVLVSFRTKYSSAERKYWVPTECLRDFVLDLRRLHASPEKQAKPTSGEEAVENPDLPPQANEP